MLAGAFEISEGSQELPVQEAYTPNSRCFGCGMWPMVDQVLSVPWLLVYRSGEIKLMC